MRLRIGHQQWQFWPILGCFMDYYSLFWGPGEVSTINEPWGAFTILTRFMDYYSPFWGYKVISMLLEKQGALTCRSLTLTILANSGSFHGLLLTLLGSRSDFHD